MKHYFTNTFFLFVVGFLVILSAAYGVFAVAAALSPTPTPATTSNTATQ